MTALHVYLVSLAALNIMVVGILIAEPGESKEFTYGQRWFSVAFSCASSAFIWWAS